MTRFGLLPGARGSVSRLVYANDLDGEEQRLVDVPRVAKHKVESAGPRECRWFRPDPVVLAVVFGVAHLAEQHHAGTAADKEDGCNGRVAGGETNVWIRNHGTKQGGSNPRMSSST